MKSLVELTACLVADLATNVGADASRDVKTLRERVEHEGDSFLTITLPTFCKDFEKALADGRVSPGLWLSFGKTHSGIPAFLQGFLSNVFDRAGQLRKYASIDCIRAVRQICLFCKKVQRECTSARSMAAAEAYELCDASLVEPSGQLWRYFGYVADFILSDFRGILNFNVEDLRPKHGPGATRERISGNQKWVFRRWHTRLEDAGFTWRLFARGSKQAPHPDEGYVPPQLVEPEDEEPTRVVFVPKTLKAPRVIAVEPVCMQYAQQALKQLLVDEIDRSPLTRGMISFHRQEINQRLAYASSIHGHLATLDMSDASDRVSLWHVERLMRSAPSAWRMMLASRSLRAELPTGKILTLKKFASMGSATCFPVEALVFFTSIIASRILRAGRFPTRHLVATLGRDVHVYGDDIIVPVHEAPAICDDLEALGFKVNRSKSFWTGQFRESCGVDCYAGELVNPVYLRRDIPANRGDASGLLSCVATANQLYDAGLYRSAAAIREAVESVFGRLPKVTPESPAVGFLWGSSPRRIRWNRDYQRFEYKALVPVPVLRPDQIDGDAALAKCLLACGFSYPGELRKLVYQTILPTREDHLLVSSMPYAIRLKRRWVPIS